MRFVETLTVKGAKTHNLKNIDLCLSHNQLTVITGLSGSGKSSLAFDTLYAEGQRRYVESLSSYARQFLDMMARPDVESIEGLRPAISIEQKTTSNNPRSTVGTVTEIYDYLRLLMARIGTPYSPATGLAIEAQNVSQMIERISCIKEGARCIMMAPFVRGRKGEYIKELEDFQKKGFQRFKIDDVFYESHELPKLNKNKKHDIFVVIDRFVISTSESGGKEFRERLSSSLETSLTVGGGVVWIESEGMTPLVLSSKYVCPESGFSLTELEPRLFSFNSPFGACEVCSGLGVLMSFDKSKIMPDPRKSIDEGAIEAFDLRWADAGDFGARYYRACFKAVLEHFGGTMKTPFNELPDETQRILFEGAGETPLTIQIPLADGRIKESHKPFEGIIAILTRRIREIESEKQKERLMAFQTESLCPSCHGDRLKGEALCVRVGGLNIASITKLCVKDALKWFEELRLTPYQVQIGHKILSEIKNRLSFLLNVGLGYLNLSRKAGTLSGGESQRIRLASQIGAGLTGVLYVLDEPSIGLHQRDNDRLLETLRRLRDLGNTVIVVEHDEDAIRLADYVIDMGPGAGIHGGDIVVQGTPQEIMKHPTSLTAAYLRDHTYIPIPLKRRSPFGPSLTLYGARENNLKNITVSFPLSTLICVTGVSGGGKSSLVVQTLYPVLYSLLNARTYTKPACSFESIEGIEAIKNVIHIDQSPIGRTPRSNPVTYIDCFSAIRDWFSNLIESKTRGYKPGRFSFNVKGGRCEKCQGDGVVKIEMHFLPDVYVTCDVCNGKRYNDQTLEVTYNGKTIADVLDMSVDEAVIFFHSMVTIRDKLKCLQEVGLGYIQLGQKATSLSGGEAQRVKLAKELSKRSSGKTVYILDEPTTGLHFEDIRKLLVILHRLVDQGNTVIVIEHNLDVIKTADWIIDMGPEGGDEGGGLLYAPLQKS